MNYAICVIIKDEHPYLAEWIEYNLKLGFNHIYIFEDYGSKSHKEITDKYDKVTLSNLKDFGIENSPNAEKQHVLYNTFLTRHKEAGDIDWCAFIDIDEFIMFQEGYNLDKLTDEFKEWHGIYLSWKMFGANGHIDRPKGGTVESYTKECKRCDKSNKWNFKSFVNIKKAIRFNTLHEIYGGCRTNGFSYHTAPQCYEKAYIAHYFTKSWEDFLHRTLKRGQLQNNFRYLDNFFECNPEFKPRREELISSITTRYKDYSNINKELISKKCKINVNLVK